jgi:ribose transport system ATP-binding protein
VCKDEIVSALSLTAIRKSFPGVEVLKGISFAFEEGRIYGLVGENGAGKSTLVKILMGLFQPDGGEISIAGERIHVHGPQQARSRYRMDAIFQEHALIPQMSIAENVFLERLQDFYSRGLLDRRSLEVSARDVLARVGLSLDVSGTAAGIPEAEKSLIELSKALDREPRILILDEATAPLASDAVQDLFDIMLRLKQAGKTLIFISHRLNEVLAVCDEILVLKDGNLEGMVDNTRKDDLAGTRKKIIRMMTGTEKGLHFPPRAACEASGPPVLSLRDLRHGRLRGVSLDVRKGEIVALAGLRGQGQSTLLRAVAGLYAPFEGQILLEGRPIRARDPRRAMQSGICYVSDRRDEEELWLSHDIRLNMSVPSIGDRARFGIIRNKDDCCVIQDMITQMRIEPPSPDKVVRQLSGGNRQKVVLGKRLLTRPKVLLMDQPAIGLDVGAKVEIYEHLRKLAETGIPTLAVLTDLEEVVNLPDRILVMHEGVITREFKGHEVDDEELLDSYYG